MIFEIHNIMDNSDYDALVQEISSSDDSKVYRDLGDGRGKKIKTTYQRSDLGQIKQPQLKNFVNEFTSKSFFRWFVKTHVPYFKKGLLQIYLPNKKHIFSRILVRINRIIGSPLNYYSIKVQNSYTTKGTTIAPHTDTLNKRLSLVFYLSERELPEQMRTDLGTIFYGIKNDGQKWSHSERIESGKTNLLNKDENIEFLKSYKPIHIAQFRQNACAGFIKNDISWHSVSKNKYDYDRKVLVVNILEL